MNQPLNQEQLNQIIAEVQGLQLRQEAELNQQQVKEILQDLNLPPELLDEALIQVRRKQALQVQQSRHKLIGLGVAAAVIMSIGLTVFFHQQKSSLLANVSAQQDKITLKSNNENLKNISRQANSELVYRVTLKDAPIGKKLNLSCNWIDPNGQVVKQNQYQTREIKTSVWDTFCRYSINPTIPVGNWQVQMLLEGRKISEETFVVQ
jgi:sulfur carrier protein ThiS